jgi:CheY-like chemotaxis protein
VNGLILVIEDNSVNRELVTDVLEANRFRVTQAQTAEEGLRLARELSPDLILMDISLPGMDGLAATRALKADMATSHLPVIALTAHVMRGDEAIALEAGCDGYLSKPIDTRKLPATIAAFIKAASGRSKGDPAPNFTAPST